jgi:hypothetical protein
LFKVKRDLGKSFLLSLLLLPFGGLSIGAIGYGIYYGIYSGSRIIREHPDAFSSFTAFCYYFGLGEGRGFGSYSDWLIGGALLLALISATVLWMVSLVTFIKSLIRLGQYLRRGRVPGSMTVEILKVKVDHILNRPDAASPVCRLPAFCNIADLETDPQKAANLQKAIEAGNVKLTQSRDIFGSYTAPTKKELVDRMPEHLLALVATEQA